MKRLSLLIILFAVLLIGCTQKTTQGPPSSPLKLLSYTNKVQLELSEELDFGIQLEYQEDLGEFSIPEIGDQIKGLRIIDPQLLPDRRIGDRVFKERKYRLMADLEGSFVLPAIEIEYELNGQKEKRSTSRIFIQVGSADPSAAGTAAVEPGAMNDILDIEPGVTLVFKRDYSGYGYLMAILVVGVLIWFLVNRSKDQVLEVLIPAHEWAEQEIRALEAQSFLNKAMVVEYYTVLSRIYRGYLKRRFDIPAEETTQQELLPLLVTHAELDEAMVGELRMFFIDSDLAKFADIFRDRHRQEQSLDYLKTFVLQTKIEEEEELEEVDAELV